MAKLSLSLPDDLMGDLRGFCDGSVKSFVTEVIREAINQRKRLARQHLNELVRELEEQVGPVDEVQVAKFAALFAEVKASQATEDYDADEDDE